MIGFTCYGNVVLRKESADKPYPSWLFGWLLGMVCYTYPGAVFSDLLFVPNAPLRALTNNNILLWFSIWYLLIQNSMWVYKSLQQKHVFIWLTTWWLADATRASLLFLERAVAHQPVFARGVWQAGCCNFQKHVAIELVQLSGYIPGSRAAQLVRARPFSTV
ncbi:ftsH [Symbiodinium necroappetens]|uniref:FtsH protein n=1 Tax=Symbiodinium necroappetens TaxID=1628268 RepID=A0A812XG68_9DINO|nr:ftsH [Symbiodinium microadriaticum]CAE7734570.1 ftsH [Symbiodinium necroappetens]